MTAEDLATLAQALNHILSTFDTPRRELDALHTRNPLNVTTWRAAVQLSSMLWHARQALFYINELHTAALLAETPGSTPDGGPSERSDFSRS